MMKRSIQEKGLIRSGSAQPHPDKPGKYRLLDGVHRWSAYKAAGMAEPDAIIIENLDGTDPLLYAAKKAIGPKQLTEDEARDTARRAYTKNTSLRSADIGKAIGRSRQTVDSTIADLRAATQLGLDIKLYNQQYIADKRTLIAIVGNILLFESLHLTFLLISNTLLIRKMGGG